MLRFFRSIRQKLLSEGKVSRYLIYALGEILLIVIGILIAVQIGKWNDARADERQKVLYLERLVVNVEEDLEQLDRVMKLSSYRGSLLDDLMEAAKDPERVRERPVRFMIAVRDSGTTPNHLAWSDTYEEMISTGYVRLLEDELYESLRRYYVRVEVSGNRQRQYDAQEDRLIELAAGILSTDQSEWLLAQTTAVNDQDLSAIEAIGYDEASVVEAAQRLSKKQELVDWIPRLQLNHRRNHTRLIRQSRLANQLLAALNTELGKKGH